MISFRRFLVHGLASAVVLSLMASTSLMAGDVILTRRSTGNWHQLAETRLVVLMPPGDVVSDAESDDISDGLPSVIAPLTAEGEQEYADDYRTADVFYTGELAGTYDHQNVIDHAMNATFAALLDVYDPAGGISAYMPHYSDEVTGSLDAAIDGDNIQFLKVGLDLEWEAGGVQSGSWGFDSYAGFSNPKIDITVYRNGTPVIWIAADGSGNAYATSMDGYDHEPVGGTIISDGDGELGSLRLDDEEVFGLWASDGDVIEYEISIGYEYSASLWDVNNPGPYHAHYAATGLMDWRFSIEDSHLH